MPKVNKQVKKRRRTANRIEQDLARGGTMEKMRHREIEAKAAAALAPPKGDRAGGSGRGRQAHSGKSPKQRAEAAELRVKHPMAARRVSAHRAGDPFREKPDSPRRPR